MSEFYIGEDMIIFWKWLLSDIKALSLDSITLENY